ncbi:MAG: VanZ family protein [Gammaproteobacteria bacterium]|nr:MAG: VanZ family protein [Gammaproteobacteria bacterium]
MPRLRWAPYWRAAGWLLLVFAVYLSLGPTSAVEQTWLLPIPYNDKLGHFLAYCALMLWFAGVHRREHDLLVAQYLFLLGLMMELAQGSLAHRSADFGDMLANTAGIATGLVLARLGVGRWCHWLERRLGVQHA